MKLLAKNKELVASSEMSSKKAKTASKPESAKMALTTKLAKDKILSEATPLALENPNVSKQKMPSALPSCRATLRIILFCIVMYSYLIKVPR